MSEKPKFENIYTDDMNNLTKVYHHYVMNLNKREKFEREKELRSSHVIVDSDPLFSFIEYSNGNKQTNI